MLSKDPDLELKIIYSNSLVQAQGFFEEGKKKLALKNFSKSQEDFNKASNLLKNLSGEEVKSLKKSIQE